MPTTNSRPQTHSDAGRFSQDVCPRYFSELGSLKTELPPLMARCRPRRAISMPSVRMNAFILTLIETRPLTRPITAPISRHSGTVLHAGSRPTPWKRSPWIAGVTSHTASIGATPIVDSSDRSIRPAMRIIASPSTSRLSSVHCWRTSIRLPLVRKFGLTMKPTSNSRRITGISDRSRSRASRRARPRGGAVRPGTATGAGAVSCSTMPSVISLTTIRTRAVQTLDGRDHLLVGPAPAELGHGAALEHDHDPVGDAQVVQLVGDDQGRPALGHRGLHRTQEGLLGLDVDAGGRADQHEDPGLAGQRPAHHHLLLVAAGQRGHRLVRAGGLDLQSVHERGGRAVAGRLGDEAEAAEPVGHRQREVLRDRPQRYQPLPVPVLGHEPDACRQRGRHAAAAPATARISPARTANDTSANSLVPVRCSTRSSSGASGAMSLACSPSSRRPVASPVIASTSASRRSPATGAVNTWRASRYTVTVWQIS